jgi:hypothetical protein
MTDNLFTGLDPLFLWLNIILKEKNNINMTRPFCKAAAVSSLSNSKHTHPHHNSPHTTKAQNFPPQSCLFYRGGKEGNGCVQSILLRGIQLTHVQTSTFSEVSIRCFTGLPTQTEKNSLKTPDFSQKSTQNAANSPQYMCISCDK